LRTASKAPGREGDGEARRNEASASQSPRHRISVVALRMPRKRASTWKRRVGTHAPRAYRAASFEQRRILDDQNRGHDAGEVIAVVLVARIDDAPRIARPDCTDAFLDASAARVVREDREIPVAEVPIKVGEISHSRARLGSHVEPLVASVVDLQPQ